jgi:hypothetical protein
MDIKKLWDQAVQAGHDRRYLRARLGKADENGLVTMVVTGRPNHLYVSLGPNGDEGVTIAINTGVPRIAWAPIRLRRENDELYIEGLDNTPGTLEAFFGDQTSPGNVSFHHHRIGSGLEYELEALRMEMARVYPVSALTVGVKPFRYYHNGAWDTWEAGSTIDLASYKPATDKWAWVLVGVNPATNALVAVKGSDQDAQADLTVDLIDSISFSGNIPCAAVQLAESDATAYDLTRWHDAHGWFNMAIDALDDLGDVTITAPAENHSFWYSGSGWINGVGHRLNIAAVQSLTIASGALDIDGTDKQHGLIDVRGESSTDDVLSTISNGQIGDVIILVAADPSTYGEITINDSGNINVVGEQILDDAGKCLTLVKTAAGWNPVGGVGVPGVSVGTAVALQISGATTNITATYNDGLIDIRPVTPGSDDTLTTINGGVEGQVIVLYVSDPTTYGDVTVSSGGNINVSDDVVLDTAGDALALVYTDVGWNPIGGGGGGGGASAFTDLSDTPASYSGQGGKYAKVNSGETAIEFAASGLAATAYHYITDSGTNEVSSASPSTSLYASKGNTITPDVDLWIRAVQFCGDISNGNTLLAKICTDDGSGNIAAVVATSASYTAGDNNADTKIWLYFDDEVQLTAGTKYYVLICWSNAPIGTSALTIYSDDIVYAIPNRNDSIGWCRVADADPAATDVVDQASTGIPFSVGYMFRTSDTPEIAGMLLGGSIDDLDDVTVDGTPADNELLAWDTDHWANKTAAEAGISGNGVRRNIGSPQSITIASGEADISAYATKPFFDIRGEGGAVDDLETITVTNSVDGDIIYLTASVETITVKDLTGNILLDSDTDKVLNPSWTLTLRYNGLNWLEIGYAAL